MVCKGVCVRACKGAAFIVLSCPVKDSHNISFHWRKRIHQVQKSLDVFHVKTLEKVQVFNILYLHKMLLGPVLGDSQFYWTRQVALWSNSKFLFFLANFFVGGCFSWANKVICRNWTENEVTKIYIFIMKLSYLVLNMVKKRKIESVMFI